MSELDTLEVPKAALAILMITPTPIEPFAMFETIFMLSLDSNKIHFVWFSLFVYPMGHSVHMSIDVELPPTQI